MRVAETQVLSAGNSNKHSFSTLVENGARKKPMIYLKALDAVLFTMLIRSKAIDLIFRSLADTIGIFVISNSKTVTFNT